MKKDYTIFVDQKFRSLLIQSSPLQIDVVVQILNLLDSVVAQLQILQIDELKNIFDSDCSHFVNQQYTLSSPSILAILLWTK